MIFFYTPFIYYYKTRLVDKNSLISWMLIYLLPIFIAASFVSQSNNLLIQYILTIILTHNLYEIGYIQNDTETVKKELNPTLRLSASELNYYCQNYIYIYAFRLFISGIITLLLMSFFDYEFNLILIWLIIPLFYIYNSIRNRVNLIVHFLLVICRFVLPVYVLTSNIFISLLMVLMFPVPNLLERATEKRFSFIWLNKNVRPHIFLFRCEYYALLSAILITIRHIYINGNEINTIIIVSLYFFIYRLAIYIYHDYFLGREK